MSLGVRKDRWAVILGWDAISPLGSDPDAQWNRALRGESGIGPLTRFPLDDRFPVRIAGQAPEVDPSAYPFLSPRALALWPSPIFRYAMITVHRALNDAGVSITPEIAPRAAVTFSSAVGGLDVLLQADRRMIACGKLPVPAACPNSCINMVGGKVSILTGATGPITATITACATGLTSLIVGAMLIAQNRADIVLCGAVDFALVEPIVAGFATMNGAYQSRPEDREPPERASRPFSMDRRGFVISEGSAAVILAAREFVLAHGLAPRAVLAGWSMTSDARHFVAPHFDTVRRCMAESIQDAGIYPPDIDAVNAHAASTRVGDQVEYEALRSVFGGRIPPVTANKSMIGHAMGASSAIETVFALTGMAKDMVLPTLNHTPDPDMPMPLDCVSGGPRFLEQEFVLKNAFGFGGCNACAVFQRSA